MENRNRILMGIGVEVFRGPAAEREGGLRLLDRVKKRLRLRPKTLGADKGFFENTPFPGWFGLILATGMRVTIGTLFNARPRDTINAPKYFLPGDIF
jgi:hypothetical protein